MTLTDIADPQVTAQVSEADIGKVRGGQPSTFTVTAYPDGTFTGTVATIEPTGQTTPNVVTYNMLINVDPTDVQFLPTMTATVTIITQEDTDAVLVPNAAISYAESQAGANRGSAGRTSGGGRLASVYVLRNGSEVLVPIEIGASDGVYTVVLSGA